ncbi:MAG: sigma-70 family RNA polymerase sigma factor [Clostridia bacterium]|nr:sigma-70 family RNA polymerase sigma factor [Clostridia bacterium]
MTRDEFVSAVSSQEKKLYLAALSVTANTEDARDAVADAVLYAWEHRDDLRDPGKFDAWILRITYSQAKMIRRKNRGFEDIDDWADAFTYETDYGRLEFFDILHRADLDKETHRILTLYFLYGYTMPEIAEMTGRKLNSVKTKYYRALRKMADMKGL